MSTRLSGKGTIPHLGRHAACRLLADRSENQRARSCRGAGARLLIPSSFPERAAEQNCARQPPRLGLPGRRKTRMPISRREWLVAACAAGINVAAAGRSRSARAQSPVVLRVSTSAAVDENSAHHLWFQKFAANVKDALGDRV